MSSTTSTEARPLAVRRALSIAAVLAFEGLMIAAHGAALSAAFLPEFVPAIPILSVFGNVGFPHVLIGLAATGMVIGSIVLWSLATRYKPFDARGYAFASHGAAALTAGGALRLLIIIGLEAVSFWSLLYDMRSDPWAEGGEAHPLVIGGLTVLLIAMSQAGAFVSSHVHARLFAKGA